MGTGIIISIALTIISSVGGIVFREWQHRSQVKAMRDVIAGKNAEIAMLKQEVADYVKALGDKPAFNPDNIQL